LATALVIARATLIKQYFEIQGLSVTLIGTIPGSASENDPYDATRSKVMTAIEKKRAIFCAYILGRSRKSKKEIQMGGFDLCDQVVQ
jgi:hypothetical protein